MHNKFFLYNQIITDLKSYNIYPIILHGVEQESIGRDVDVLIPKHSWNQTKDILIKSSQKIKLKIAYINSISGLRFLFFSEDQKDCGFFEFHCVRSLDWFWLSPPLEEKALSVHKRFTLPLLSKDISKLHKELETNPISENEENLLLSFLNYKKIINQSDDIFINLVKEKKLECASNYLRKKILNKTFLHPIKLVLYIIKRIIITPVWLFNKPCGPVILIETNHYDDTFVDNLKRHKGVLTKIISINVNKYNLLHVLLLSLKLRIAQGHQRGIIILHNKKQRWISRFFVLPIQTTYNDDVIVTKINDTLYKMLKKFEK